MISRIVKMTFETSKVDEFLRIFEQNAEKIRAFKGCKHLELLHSRDFPNMLFTFSLWENAENLDEYRASGLFIKTWEQTKKLFSAPPEAWSLVKMWPDADNFSESLKI